MVETETQPLFKSAWNLPASVTEHQGSPLAADCDFFADPPPDIGRIRTAHTSLKQGVKPKSAMMRLVIALGWGAALEILLLVIHRTVGFPWFRLDGDSDPPVALVFAPVALLAAAIAWFFVRFRHNCSYVGDDGIAYFTCRQQRAKIKHLWTFHFKDAASLVTSSTHHFKNSAYTHTSFGFFWYSSNNAKSVFGLKDSHRSHIAGPPAENLYHLCRSAESAWYHHLAPLMEDELARGGRVRFQTSDGGYTALGPGFIEIGEGGGKITRLSADEIGNASIANHILEIARPGAAFSVLDFPGRLGSFLNRKNQEGVYRFHLTVHNVQMFRHLFNRFIGVHI